MWVWALVAAATTAGLSIAVNLATELKHSWFAWIAVGVLTILTGAVSLGIQGRSSITPAPDASTLSSPTHRLHKNVVVQSESIQGGVHIGQSGRHIFIAQIPALLIVAVLAFTVLSSGSPIGQSSGHNENSAQTNPSTSTAATTKSSGPGPALGLTTDWPLMRGCSAGNSVAMPIGGPDIKVFNLDGRERNRMIEAGGASWATGFLYVHLSTTGDEKINILNLRPIIDPKRLAPPIWVYEPGMGCGGPSDRVFELNLDKPSLQDKGIVEGTAAIEKGTRIEPIGPEFFISADQSASLRFDVLSCRGNYTWSLEITYATSGSSEKFTKTVGPFRSMGLAEKSAHYTIGFPTIDYADAGELSGFTTSGWCRR